MVRSTKVGDLTPDDIDLCKVLKSVMECKINTKHDEVVIGMVVKNE